MPIRSMFTLLIALYTFAGQSQPKKNYFKLHVTNNSNFTTACTILGNDKTDSVPGKQAKTILFDLDNDQVSFYLSCWTTGTTAGSYQHKLIRVLNTQKSKYITIDTANQLNYQLTKSEKIIEASNPQLRTKNFWKLDSVIKTNAGDIAAAEIIFLSICDIDVKTDTIKKYYNLLTKRVKATAFGNRIANYLVTRSRLNTGSKIDNFSLPDTTGRTVSLTEIKSDYVLLDFWFSRCGPCIKSFPELQDLYSKTSRQKLEIIGISIDQPAEKELWKNTIRKHNLTWLNVNDTKAKTARYFAIVNYPIKILLDKNKRVILVDTDNSYKEFYQETEKLITAK